MERNVLGIVAHPDDLEIMAGGTLLKWKSEGAKVHSLVLTDGCGIAPNGQPTRDRGQALDELERVSHFMEYDTCEMLDEKNLFLIYKDEVVCEILRRIKDYKIDTIISCWDKDTNHDHKVTAEMAKMAARHVPNFLMGQINYYIHDFYTPNVYVDISLFWERKLNAVKMFGSAWNNHEQDWYDFLNSTALYFGRIEATSRAEGFISTKLLL